MSGREYRRALFVVACVLALALAAVLLPAATGPSDRGPLESLVVDASPQIGQGTEVGSGLGALDPGQLTAVGGLDGGDGAFQSQSAAVHFTVESSQPAYWRTGAYDRYTGTAWEQSGDDSDYDGPLSVDGVAGESVSYEVELNRSAGALPTVWRPETVTADADLSVTDSRAITAEDRLPAGATYSGESVRPVDDERALRTAGRNYPGGVADQYTQLPDDTPSRLGSFTDRLTADADSPYEAARTIEAWLETNKTYSLAAESPETDHVATTFAFEMDAGYCEYFASTMVAMLRTQDIPARYVVGYSTGQETGEDTYTVRGMNAHAWVEMYVPDVGWVRFDPTPGQARLATERDALESQRPDSPEYDPTEQGSPNETFSPDDPATPPEDVDPTVEDPATNDTDTNGTEAPNGTDSPGETDPGDTTPNGTDGSPPPDDGTDGSPGDSTGGDGTDGNETTPGGGDGTNGTDAPNGTDGDGDVPGDGSGDGSDGGTGGTDGSGSDGSGDGDGATAPLSVALDGDPVPGSTVTVSVTRDDRPVDGATVLFDGESVGTTGPNGTVTGTVPFSERLNVTVRTSSADAVGSLAAPGRDPVSDRLYAAGSITGGLGSGGSDGALTDETNRTFRVATNASLSLSGTVATGQTVLLTATVRDVALANATVRLDGAFVGETDASGRLRVALPGSPGEYTVSVERDPVAGNRTVTLDPLTVSVDPSLPAALPGTAVTVTATLGNESVAGVPVTVDGDPVGTTGVDGTLTTTLPLAGSATVGVTEYGQTATATVEGLWTTLGIAVAVALAIVAAAALLARRRGTTLRRVVAAAFVAAVDGLVAFADLLVRVGAGAVRSIRGGIEALAAFLRGRLDAAELRALFLAWAGRVRASARAEAAALTPRRFTANADPDRTTIRAAWHRFLDTVSVTDPDTKTPGEVARQAVEREGLPADPVRTLRDAFRAVEYGARDPEEYEPAVEQALEDIEATTEDDS